MSFRFHLCRVGGYDRSGLTWWLKGLIGAERAACLGTGGYSRNADTLLAEGGGCISVRLA